ncbi:HAMP domain-containing protein [Billgrantia gudaonensis]|uniref:HAMP domain-containing protein n=1 Tax=Billgrantia gudaonensis TaxID=376427 RepID=A0A3S0QRM2_9GAMM|nr:HAMP domain-containing protein [Halomonas gudaonensis]
MKASLERAARPHRALGAALVTFSILTAINCVSRAVWSIRRRILQPLERLRNLSEPCGGDIEIPLPPFHNDEIGTLARAFEHLRTRDRRHQAA